MTVEGRLDLVLKEDPCYPVTQPQFFSVDVDADVPQVIVMMHDLVQTQTLSPAFSA